MFKIHVNMLLNILDIFGGPRTSLCAEGSLAKHVGNAPWSRAWKSALCGRGNNCVRATLLLWFWFRVAWLDKARCQCDPGLFFHPMNWKITRPILQSLRNWNIHWQMGLIPVSGPRIFFSPKGGATAHQEAEKMFWNDSNYRTSIQCVPYFVSTGPLRSQMIILEDRCTAKFYRYLDRRPYSWSSIVFLL